ncbi:MAG: sugar phosphate isomerase/epimerase [Sedimentitalea sp.]|uniref:sugar phosphate isomerase/epimerase family protein n=1 Tax=Sedimentitalea sp. TaxID=2048915 RepID=UPI003262CCF6
MKIGMCMFLWTTNIGPEHKALLADIRETGFDGVEVPVFEGTVEDFAATGRMLDELGLARTAAAANGNPEQNLISENPSHRAAGLDHMNWVLDCTAALGADRVNGPLHSTLGHFSGSGPTREEFERSIDSLRQAGELASKSGVTVCLEAVNRFECYLLNTIDSLADHIRTIGHPNIQAMYDTFHANIEETDPIGALVRNKGIVKHIHISENDRGVPGRGNIPWQETYAAIRQIGYDDWLTIEAFGRGLPDLAAATKVWRDFSESPEAVYREGFAHIQQSMHNAGFA